MDAPIENPLSLGSWTRGSLRVAALVLALGVLPVAASETEAPELPAAERGANTTADERPLASDSAGSEAELTEGEDPDAARDPLEEVNRAFFFMNRGLEWLIFDPISRVYGCAVPEVGKRAVHRVLENLNIPVVMANDLLRLELLDAGSATARFAINTTVGLLGLWDPASRLGLEEHRSSFGQTLAWVGVPNGPYLVLPVIGPTTARDAVGDAIDLMFRPQTYLLGTGQLLVLGTGEGITIRERYLEELDELRKSSVDYYATVRSAYFMLQEAELREVGLWEAEASDPLLDHGF